MIVNAVYNNGKHIPLAYGQYEVYLDSALTKPIGTNALSTKGAVTMYLAYVDDGVLVTTTQPITVTTAYAILYADGELVFQRTGDVDVGRETTATGMTNFEDTTNRPWDSNKSKIRTVTFRDVVSPITTAEWFSSCTQLTTVNAANLNTRYVTSFSRMFADDPTLALITTTGWDTRNVTTMYQMFYNCSVLTYVDVSHFNLAKTTTLESIFHGCTRINNLDVADWNTATVTNMSSMFRACSSMDILDIENWNVNNVTTFNYMFADCTLLPEIDLSGWITKSSPLATVNSMFENCTALRTIYATDNFSVTDNASFANGHGGYYTPNYSGTFNNCPLLVGGNGTAYATYTKLFYNTASYSYSYNNDKYNYPNAHIDKPWNPGYFTDKNAREIPARLSSIVITTAPSKTEYDYNDLFVPTGMVVTAVYNNGTTTSVPAGSYNLYTDYANAVSADASPLRTVGAMNITVEFEDDSVVVTTTQPITVLTACAILYEDGDLVFQRRDIKDSGRPYIAVYNDFENTGTKKWDADKSSITRVTIKEHIAPTNVATWFKDCTNLLSFVQAEEGYFDLTSAVSMSELFSGCTSLSSVDTRGWNTSNVTNMYCMFYNCSTLTYLDVSHLDLAKTTTLESMFNGCSRLNNLDIANWNTAAVKNMVSVFNGCSSLTAIDVCKWNVNNVTTFNYMFANCSSVSELDLSGWITKSSPLATVNNMFENCTALRTIYATDNFSVTDHTSFANAHGGYYTSNYSGTFNNCPLLVGGNGTAYATYTKRFYNNASYSYGYNDDRYNYPNAHIDKPWQPGYFTEKYLDY